MAKLHSFEDYSKIRQEQVDAEIKAQEEATREETVRSFKDLLAEYGVTKVSELKEEQRSEFFAKLEGTDLNESISLVEEGTSSFFGKIDKKGDIEAVYLHYDGYPENMLPLIKKGYSGSKRKNIDSVLMQGDSSGLEADPKKMNFYGDANSAPEKGNAGAIGDFIKNVRQSGAEFLYLYDERDGSWYMADTYDDISLRGAFESVEIEEVNEGLHPKLKKAQKAIEKGETVYGENIRFPGRFKILELGGMFAKVDYEDGSKPMEMATMNIRIDSLQFESVELNEAKLSKKDTAEIAQKIADIFTQESADAKEFFKYVVSSGVSPMSFDLDVEKTAKTPKKLADEPNYFGEYAGGSFVIKDEEDCYCVYNAAMGMAHIEKFSKDDLSLIKESIEINEALIVTGKRAAKSVMKAYEGFFKAYPALGANAMGVPAIHHLGAIKELYKLAMEDANFGREVPATANKIKGKLFPVELKQPELNNMRLKVSTGKLMSAIEDHAGAISGAAKFSGLAIVEGTALYLDSLNHGKYAEELLNAFNATFESTEAMEARILEGNAFGAARMKAIADGKDEFEFDGETYKVKSVDKEDKEAAKELTETEINGENTNPVGYPSPAGDSEEVENDHDEEVEVMGESSVEVSEGLNKSDVQYQLANDYVGRTSPKVTKLNKKKLEVKYGYKVDPQSVIDSVNSIFPEVKLSHIEWRDIMSGGGVHSFAIEESVVTEAEVKSDEEFKEYAFTVLQNAFGEDFDEAKAQEVVDGILAKSDGDYGVAIGMLTSSLG